MFDNSAILELLREKRPEIVTVTAKSAGVTKPIVTATEENNHLKSMACNDSGVAVTAVTVVTKPIVTATKKANPLKSITYDCGNGGNGGNGKKQHPRNKNFFSELTQPEQENFTECGLEQDVTSRADEGMVRCDQCTQQQCKRGRRQYSRHWRWCNDYVGKVVYLKRGR